MGSKENNSRHNKPFMMRGNNIFNYLDEVNKKDNAKIILPAPTENSSPESKTKKFDKKAKGNKNDITEPLQTEEEEGVPLPSQAPEVPMDEIPTETPEDTDTQGDVSLEDTDTQGDVSLEAQVSEGDRIAEIVSEESENAQSNEESPQGESIEVEEVVENGSN
jgi:hypothetical protein